MNNLPALEAIFFAALEKGSPVERSAYLDEACAGDPETRRQVEKMLAAQARDGSFLERPAHLAGVTVDQPARETTGTYIGPYKLIEPIGEGGMGAVWMAQQTEPVKRLVAVKLIKAGMDSKQVIARFEAERQALALMDHPNIARVLDGGTTDAGRPYFVMDLVKGVPITKYCDEHRLTPRQRLELFIPVCQAVQHAHQKGIIHRDLKPSNVLVALYDGRPVPKVIDFGVAKAAGQVLTDKTLVTGFGAVVGTLEYMSPEQAEVNQLDIDTRSDVYSLGVLLYELLAGSTPFSKKDLEKAGMLELLRVIREQEPSRPSTKLSTADGLPTLAANRGMEPAKLTKLVRGELDWIVMKALEKDRTRRYETANGFAMDVHRYLADEAVLACPPSAGYRLRKFARRNRLGLTTAASILVFVLSLAAVIGWALRDRDAREREAASEKKAREAALDDEVKRNLDDAEALIDQEKWPEAAVAGHRTRDLLAAERRRETPSRLQELERDLAIVRSLEDIYARPKGEAFFTGAEQDAAYAKVFADCGIDVATLPVAEAAGRIRARRIRGELVRGLEFWSLARRYANSQAPPDWKQLLEIAIAADQDVWRNQVRDALKADDKKALLDLAASADARKLPPQTLVLLGRTLSDLGGHDQAQALLREAQRQYPADLWINDSLGVLCLQSQPPQHDDAVRFYSVAVALRPGNPYMIDQVGNALLGKGALDEALATFSRAIALKPDFLEAWSHRGIAYVKVGQVDKGIADLTKAIELSPNSASAWNERAVVFADSGQYEKAIADLSKAIELSPKYVTALHNRGASFYYAHQYDKALLDLNKAIELDPRDAYAWNERGKTFSALHQYDKAVVDYSKALELDPNNWKAWNNRGAAYGGLHQHDKAIADYSVSIELNPKNATAWTNRGAVHDELHQYEKAIADCSKAIELDPKNAAAWANRGEAYNGLRQYDKAIADFSTAIKVGGSISTVWNSRGAAYNWSGRYGEAIADFNKAIELDPKNAAAWANRGFAYGHLRQYDRAIDDFSKAIEVDPNYPLGWNNRGTAHRLLHQYDKAIDDYSKAIELDPKDAVFWDNRGAAYAEKGQWQKAAADLVKVTELQKNNVPAWYWRALLYLKLDDHNAYRQVCGAMLDAFRGAPPETVRLVAWACSLGPDHGADSDRLVELAEKLAAQNSKNRSDQTIFGAALYRAGRFKDAQSHLDQAAALPADPFQPVEYTWYFLAMTHHRLGHGAEAREWLEKARKQPEPKAEDSDVPWNRRLSLQLLSREAEALLGIKENKEPETKSRETEKKQ